VSVLHAGGEEWTPYTTADRLIGDDVLSVIVDDEGNAWFGTGNGISKLSADGRWTTYLTADGLASNDVRAIAIDDQDNKCFGSKRGVSRLSVDGSWTTYTTAMAWSAI